MRFGLLAHSALAAAYGTRSSIRHLYPVSPGGGGNTKARESALWPAGMALHYRDLLYNAVSASPHDPCWVCSCPVCGGQRLDRLDMAPLEEVRQHNTASLLDIRAEMAAVPAGQAARSGGRGGAATLSSPTLPLTRVRWR